MSDTSSRVERICRELSGVGETFSIHNETQLAWPTERNGLDLDSMDRILLAMKLEDEFHIQIPDDDVDKQALGTFGGLVAYIEGKRLAREQKFEDFKRNVSDMTGGTAIA